VEAFEAACAILFSLHRAIKYLRASGLYAEVIADAGPSFASPVVKKGESAMQLIPAVEAAPTDVSPISSVAGKIASATVPLNSKVGGEGEVRWADQRGVGQG
jgi:hypothetical protein